MRRRRLTNLKSLYLPVWNQNKLLVESIVEIFNTKWLVTERKHADNVILKCKTKLVQFLKCLSLLLYINLTA